MKNQNTQETPSRGAFLQGLGRVLGQSLKLLGRFRPHGFHLETQAGKNKGGPPCSADLTLQYYPDASDCERVEKAKFALTGRPMLDRLRNAAGSARAWRLREVCHRSVAASRDDLLRDMSLVCCAQWTTELMRATRLEVDVMSSPWPQDKARLELHDGSAPGSLTWNDGDWERFRYRLRDMYRAWKDDPKQSSMHPVYPTLEAMAKTALRYSRQQDMGSLPRAVFGVLSSDELDSPDVPLMRRNGGLVGRDLHVPVRFEEMEPQRFRIP